jgi:RNA polymerase sigma-70 factor (ECF subfamily)
MIVDGRTDRIRQHLLVLRCQTGDDDAFATLYAEYGGRSLRYLRSLIGDDAADDVQQETWLAVYRRIGSLADPARFPTWLLATARNRAIDWMRRRKRERTLFEEATAEPADVMIPEEQPPGPGFDDPLVSEALAGLPTAQREVLMLRYRDELTYSEIAIVTSCAIGTVRSRLHHARLNLERRLDAHRIKDPQQVMDTTTGRPQ